MYGRESVLMTDIVKAPLDGSVGMCLLSRLHSLASQHSSRVHFEDIFELK